MSDDDSDDVVDRAEIYEKAGRRDEAERLLAGLKHARDILEERVGRHER